MSRERVRGWRASQARVEELGRQVREQYVDPAASGFHVVVTRDSVAMVADATDNTRVLELDERTAHPTLGTLVSAIRDKGRWVSTTGSPTTWVLRESVERTLEMIAADPKGKRSLRADRQV